VDRAFLGFVGRAAGRALPAGGNDSLRGEARSNLRLLRHFPVELLRDPRKHARRRGAAKIEIGNARHSPRRHQSPGGATWRDVARRAASTDFSGKFTAAARAWHRQTAMLGFFQLT
jgi:hypothetical protein